MGTRSEQGTEDPLRWRVTFWCDRCPLEDNWTVELMAPEAPTAIGLAQRMIREQGWHISDANVVTCPGCVGSMLEPPSTELREGLYRSPVDFGLSIVTPIQQVTVALAQGRPAPAAGDFYHWGCQALSRSYPDNPRGLREALDQLGPLLHPTGDHVHASPLPTTIGYPSSMLAGMEIVDQQGLRYVVTEAHPEGSATIVIDGKVMGMVPVPTRPKIERIPPKSSWERLMEDDDDECP